MSDVLDEKLNISTPAQDVLPVPVRRLRGARARRPFMSVVWTSWKLPIFINFQLRYSMRVCTLIGSATYHTLHDGC